MAPASQVGHGQSPPAIVKGCAEERPKELLLELKQ